uniref:Uncharacterized protein n=1 Tax=Phyllymenia taiwanensis TaxID=1260292 RepID=R9XYQ4_9FLOR|nr:hypothetical protein [Grateloupia taiwanensis]AGO19806.1 hypothetical protein [Grateloupia taiwanensis]
MDCKISASLTMSLFLSLFNFLVKVTVTIGSIVLLLIM